MKTVRISYEIPVAASYDVIVAGGGLGGVAAALSAARHKKKVLLIEKTQKLGGLATTGLVNLFVPMCNGQGKQIIAGMAEELLRLSIQYGYDTLAPEWENGEPKLQDGRPLSRYRTRFSPEIFAMAMTELLRAEGVTMLFDTVVTRPIMTENHCDGLLVENKSGTQYYQGGIIVDATGDADILFRAGVPTVQGINYFTYYAQEITLDSCKKAVESRKINDAIHFAMGGKANLYGQNHPQGMPYFTGTDSDDINRYLIDGQCALLDQLKKQDRFSREIITLPGMPQMRTTRHIAGDYVLQEEDVYRHFDDSIAAVCDFDRKDYLYEIPYRCLINSRYDNLITVGRTVSAEGYAWDVARVIPPAIVTGQAAGAAAAMALEQEIEISDVCISDLQKALQSESVMIHFDDAWIPKDGPTSPYSNDFEIAPRKAGNTDHI